MSAFIGLAHGSEYFPRKRDALYFDRFGLIAAEQNLADQRSLWAEYDWLAERGVVFDAGLDYSTALTITEVRDAAHEAVIAGGIYAVLSVLAEDPAAQESLVTGESVQRVVESVLPVSSLDIANVTTAILDGIQQHLYSVREFGASALHERLREADRNANVASVRLMANHFRRTEAIDAIPVLPDFPVGPKRMDLVAKVVIDALPMPDDATPWEAILDFRSDVDAVHALRRLRLWTTKSAAGNTDVVQLSQELDVLVDEYESYMRLHRFKIVRGPFLTLVTLAAEVLENAPRLRFSKIASAIASLATRRLDLLDAERAAPGRELAYIALANERWRR